jgi:hypothetical protein
MASEWVCPFCDRAQIATHINTHMDNSLLNVGANAEGLLGTSVFARACLNPVCKRTSFRFEIGPARENSHGSFLSFKQDQLIFSQRVVPQGSGKPQPEFIPVALREDYGEACLIRDLSPKASATLVRRCLQGMIRDFAKISKQTLAKEIDALRNAVEQGSADRAITIETVEAIDHVRSIGNIGAHMEKDIDLIVPVEPIEAQALIELVEMLFEEWYVARETRAMRLARIEGIATEKKSLKLGDETGAVEAIISGTQDNAK